MQLRDLEKTYSKSTFFAEEQMFNLLNNVDTVNLFIDLHGQHKNRAIEITQDTLRNVQQRLDSGELEPNFKNGADHVFKIICGRGKGSKNGIPVLKVAIPKLLSNEGYEFYPDDFHGVFLVRLTKQT